MYTRAENHIVVQMMHIRDKHYIRIVPVVHTKHYIAECQTLYNDWNDDNMIVFYNCALHYDRLITNIGYKKFSKFNLCTYKDKKSVWEVNGNNYDSVQSWYHNELGSYIRAKLHSYFEDSMGEDSETIDLIAEAAKMPPESLIDLSDCIKLITDSDDRVTAFELINLERDKQTNMYILSMRDIIAIMFYAFCYIGYSRDAPVEPVNFTRCPFTGTLSHSFCTFSAAQVKHIVKSTFGKSYELASNDFPFYESFVKNTIHKDLKYAYTPCNLDFAVIDNTGLIGPNDSTTYSSCEFEAPDTSMWGLAEILELCSPIENVCNTTSDITVEFESDAFSLCKPGTIREIKKIHKAQSAHISNSVHQSLYRNAITNKVQFLDRPVKFLEEFELISDVGMKTAIGMSLLDKLSDITELNVLDVMEDLRKYMETISMMFGIDTSKDTKTTKQRELTAQYVAKFKDDTAETLASDVYEKAHAFLSAFMQNKDINSNQIGQDMVELGLKKTRKARGYVYTVLNPSLQELRTFTHEVLKSSR